MLNIFAKLSIGQIRNFGPFASAAIHTSAALSHKRDRELMVATSVKKEEGTRGELSIDIDNLVSSPETKRSIFPDINLPDRLFHGTPFKELPICNIRVSKNNTIVNVTDYKGTVIFINSCGIEGYKNTRKGTNIAAQATAMTISAKALDRGMKTIRVVVRGLGPGRLSAIKGLQMGGMDIISITDATRVTYNPVRPRKPRRL